MGKETRIKKKKAKRRSALDWARVAVVLIGLVAIFVTIFLDESIIISLELNQISKVELENSYFRTENGIVINNFRDTIIFPDDKLTFKITLINKSEKTIDYTPIIRILQGEVIVKGPIQLENRTLIPYEGWTFYQKEFFVGGEGAKRLEIEIGGIDLETGEKIPSELFEKDLQILSLSDKIQSDQAKILFAGIIASAAIGGITLMALYLNQRTANREVIQLEKQNELMKKQNKQLQKQFNEQMKIMNVDVHSKTMARIFELLTNPDMKTHKQKIANGYWAFKDAKKPVIFQTGSASTSASIVKQAFDQACLQYELGLVNREQFLAVYGGNVVRFWKILQEDIEDDQRGNPEICKFFQNVAQKFIEVFHINAEPYRYEESL